MATLIVDVTRQGDFRGDNMFDFDMKSEAALKKVVGKTVKNIAYDCEVVTIHFTDGTSTTIEATYYTREFIGLSVANTRNTC